MSAAKDPDPKLEELRQRASLHPRPGRVCDELFATSDFFDPRDAIQVKYEMLRRVRVDGRPIAQAARNFGYSRPTFYEALAAFEREGLQGLLPHKRGPQRAHKLTPEVMNFVIELLREEPSLSVFAVVERIDQHFQLRVHPRSVERALARQKKGS